MQTGVFIGRIPPPRVLASFSGKSAPWPQEPEALLIAYATNNEQGFAMEMAGERTRNVRDFEGLSLVTVQ